MKIGREVDDLRGRGIVGPGAGVGKAESVNAIGMFVDEDKSFSRNDDGGEFVVSAPGCLALVVSFVEPFAVFAENLTHADAAHAWQKIRTDSNSGTVAGTFEDGGILTDVGVDGGWGQCNARVPIAWFGGKIKPARD